MVTQTLGCTCTGDIATMTTATTTKKTSTTPKRKPPAARKTSVHDEADIFARTSAAMIRSVTDGVPQQPSRHLSGFEGKVYVLRNIRGEMARYSVSDKGRIRRIDAAA
jgi:hypothetical protein